MILWGGLIVILVGFVWSTFVCRNTARAHRTVSDLELGHHLSGGLTMVQEGVLWFSVSPTVSRHGIMTYDGDLDLEEHQDWVLRSKELSAGAGATRKLQEPPDEISTGIFDFVHGDQHLIDATDATCNAAGWQEGGGLASHSGEALQKTEMHYPFDNRALLEEFECEYLTLETEEPQDRIHRSKELISADAGVTQTLQEPRLQPPDQISAGIFDFVPGDQHSNTHPKIVFSSDAYDATCNAAGWQKGGGLASLSDEALQKTEMHDPFDNRALPEEFECESLTLESDEPQDRIPRSKELSAGAALTDTLQEPRLQAPDAMSAGIFDFVHGDQHSNSQPEIGFPSSINDATCNAVNGEALQKTEMHDPFDNCALPDESECEFLTLETDYSLTDEDEIYVSDESSADELLGKFTSTEFQNIGKTLRSLIASVSESEKLEQKDDERVGLLKMRCFINLERCMYDMVRSTASKFGMRKSNSVWDVMWIDVEAGTKSKEVFNEKCRKMNAYQIISHFPGFWSLSSKDLWIKNMQRMLKRFPKDFNVFPRSWILPRDGLQLSSFARKHKWAVFIVKPTDRCAGNGISVTKNVKLDKKTTIYQLYLRPFLIDGYKFDFRVYVLMTSCNPLRLYVHNEGIARFATVKYEEPSRENIDNVFMHLTNSCVNAKSPLFVRDGLTGHSRKMSSVFEWFRRSRIDADRIRDSMDDAIIKTIIAVLPTLRRSYKAQFPLDAGTDRCFEILGFDVMLDAGLNVYVLEVNPSPSFGLITRTAFEAELKQSVLFDTFRILEGNVMYKLRQRCRSAINRGKHRRKLAEESIRASIEWENSHLGNFRKVYPQPNREKYYRKFMGK